MSEHRKDSRCDVCGKPFVADTSGSVTQWVTACACSDRPALDDKSVRLCPRCGKRVMQRVAASLTQWIFKTDHCKCDYDQLLPFMQELETSQPSESPDDRLARENTPEPPESPGTVAPNSVSMPVLAIIVVFVFLLGFGTSALIQNWPTLTTNLKSQKREKKKKKKSKNRLKDFLYNRNGQPVFRILKDGTAVYSTEHATDDDIKLLIPVSGIARLDLRSGFFHGEGLGNITNSLIEELDMENQRLSKAGAKELSQMSRLKRLRLSRGYIPPGGLRHIATLPRLQSLEAMFAKLPTAEIGALGQCSSLRELSIPGQETLPIEELAELTGLKELTYLSLSNTPLNSTHIEEINKVTSLRRLYMWDCSLSDKEVGLLDASRLDLLNIGRNDLSDASVRHLAKSTSLRQIVVRQCPKISEAAIQEIRKKNPHTVILSGIL